MMEDDDAVKVHVINLDDIKITRTEEIEPAHFTASSFILPVPGLTSGGQADENANVPTQILQLDPLRKETVISFNGSGQVILAHSNQQAQSLQQGTNQFADDGFLVTAPSSIRVEGTGPLWAIAASGSAASANTVTGQSKFTSPTAGQIMASIAAASLPAGTYTVYTNAYIDGTFVAATDDDNIELGYGSTIVGALNVPADTAGQTGPLFGPYMITLNGAQALKLIAIATGTVGSVYHTWLSATPYPAAAASGFVTVGVLQERRGA
jgi:hypothetical protein